MKIAVNQGGTGTQQQPTSGQLLIGKSDGSYALATLTDGTGILITEGSGTITIASTVTAYTDELAQDAVGGILLDTTRINLVYDDATPTISADLISNTITAGYLSASATDILFGRSTAGAGAGEEVACTAFARSILDDANEAAFKATVNLEIGTDVQAYDADLTVWGATNPDPLNGNLVLHGGTGAGPTWSGVDLTADVINILTSVNGGTGNGFTKFSGPATGEKTFTLPNASATILTSNAAVTVAQGGTGVTSTTAYAVLCGGTTTTNPLQSIASVGSAGQVLTSNGAGTLPTFQDAGAGAEAAANKVLRYMNLS